MTEMGERSCQRLMWKQIIAESEHIPYLYKGKNSFGKFIYLVIVIMIAFPNFLHPPKYSFMIVTLMLSTDYKLSQ